MIFGINTITKCGTWQLVKFQLVYSFELDQKWNDFLLYLWINVGNINSRDTIKIVSFQEREIYWNFTGCQVPHFMIVLIPYISSIGPLWVPSSINFLHLIIEWVEVYVQISPFASSPGAIWLTLSDSNYPCLEQMSIAPKMFEPLVWLYNPAWKGVKVSEYFTICTFVHIPAGTQHQNDVISTSMRRDHVASTLIRRHFNVVCPLGYQQHHLFYLWGWSVRMAEWLHVHVTLPASDLETAFNSRLCGALLHRAFYYYPISFSLWLKYCWIVIWLFVHVWTSWMYP